MCMTMRQKQMNKTTEQGRYGHTKDIMKGIEAVDLFLMTVAMVARGELIRITARVHPVSPM